MNTWVTSDSHFNHKNIISFCQRPFSSVEEMNEVLIDNWNKTVKPADTVYHLGDFGFFNKEHPVTELKVIFRRLNGNKIFIRGNHDNSAMNQFGWGGVVDYQRTVIDGVDLVLFHFQIKEWVGAFRGAIHLHGHEHNHKPSLSPYKVFDVGVDAWNFRPVSLEEIVELAKTKENMPIPNRALQLEEIDV